MTDAMPAAAYRLRATEADLERTVRDLVALRGGRFFHLRDARQAPELADLPDWLIVLPPRLYVIEAKSQKRQITSGQAEVVGLLLECTELIAGVVRPQPKPGEIGFDELIEILEGAP